jgi:hypothetical protein
MRRLWRVSTFAFGKPASGAAQWGPLVLTALGTAATAVGLALPKPGGYWLAIAGLVGLGLVLFLAVFRLHRAAYPDFPDHRLTHGPLWVLDNPQPRNEYENKLIVFDVDFTNREPTARIHLTVDLWWIHDLKVQPKRRRFWFDSKKSRPLGPFRIWPYRGSLGGNKVLGRPVVVDGHDRADGMVAFVPNAIPGLEIGDEASDLTAEEGFRFFIRLMDDVSGAQRDEDVVLPRTQP